MRRSLARLALARLVLAALVAAVILALGAAVAGARSTGADLKQGGTLTIALAEEPDALDPSLARTFVGRVVFLHMCEKLYDLDRRLAIVPQLAAGMPQISKDKLTYTIRIRSGIKFNDGTALTPAAVKQSLERHLNLKGSVRASEISPIDSISTTRNAVVLKLKTPYSPLVAQLADRAGMIMSPKALNALGDRFATAPVCVGPFQFKERVAGDRIVLTKSQDYYGRSKVHLAQIVFRIVNDPSSRTQALRAGDIQVLDRVQSTDVPTLQRTKSLSVLKTATIGYQGITLNIGNQRGINKGYGPVDTDLSKSAQLRQAFELAIDRTTINRVVFNGLNQPGCFPISPVSPWFAATKGLPCNLKADVAQARRLVAASGIQNPSVRLMIGTDPVAARLGQVIQAMEKQVGIDVTLQPTEFVAALNRADSGNFDAFAIGWSGRVDPDGNIYGFVASDGTLNEAGFSNDKVDYVLRGARKSVTQKSRLTLYASALQSLRSLRPVIYLWHPVNYYGVSGKVTGVAVYGDGLIRAYNAAYK